MREKNLFFIAILCLIVFSFSSCKREDTSSNTVRYQPDYTFSCGLSGSDAAKCADLYVNMLSNNGFDASTVTLFTTTIVVTPRIYTQTHVANADTAAARKQLMQKALADYSTYINIINNYDMSTEATAQNCIFSGFIDGTIMIGTDTLSFYNSVSMPPVTNQH